MSQSAVFNKLLQYIWSVTVFWYQYKTQINDKFWQQIRNWQKKIPNGFEIAVLFFSSTYCRLECVVSVLFLAYVVKAQREVISVEIINMGKFYKNTLVKNKFAHFTSLWFAEDTQVPKVSLSLACWFWLLAGVSFLHCALLQNCACTHNVHLNPWWLSLILKYKGVFQVIENNW